MNFALDGERVVFRTDIGTKTRSLGQDVCFEVDSFDREAKTGWSVVNVTGRPISTPAAVS